MNKLLKSSMKGCFFTLLELNMPVKRKNFCNFASDYMLNGFSTLNTSSKG